MFHSHVIQNEQVGLQITSHCLLMAFESFIVQQIAHSVEDAAIKDSDS